MINRTLLRIKIVQILFSYYKNPNKTLHTTEKELIFSFQKTYDLYFHLLQLAVDVTFFAQQRVENGKNKLRPTTEELNPNTRFVNNLFTTQLATNEHLKNHVQANKLSWVDYPEIIKELYNEIMHADFYTEYMQNEVCSYEDDKKLWRKIYSKIIIANEALENCLEDQSIYWANDIETIISFVIKTIKKFDLEAGAKQELLEMFRSDDELEFAQNLLRNTITKAETYQELITKHTQNWDFDRLAYMDTIIMQVAVAEIMSCPTIPVNVTLNEYMEIAKEFSTDKSAKFINGVLDEIVSMLKKENKLMKAVVLSNKQK